MRLCGRVLSCTSIGVDCSFASAGLLGVVAFQQHASTLVERRSSGGGLLGSGLSALSLDLEWRMISWTIQDQNSEAERPRFFFF